MYVCGAGNIERVRGLVFDCLRQRRMALHSMLLAVAATWPQVLITTGLLVLVAANFEQTDVDLSISKTKHVV